MPVMDEFREERAALKNAPFKQKAAYFWDYYKWHVIVTISVILLVSVMISQILSRKDTALYLAMVNAADITSEELPDNNFAEYISLDTDKSDIVYDTSMLIDFSSSNEYIVSSLEKFVTYVAAAQLDIVVSGEEVIQKYAHNEVFLDISQFLSAEQTAKYSPYFYYIDYSVIEEIRIAQGNYDYDFVPQYPDPGKPETMKQPVPIGIYVTDCPALTDRFSFTRADSGIILSVVANTTHTETVSKYIDFLMESRTDSAP